MVAALIEFAVVLMINGSSKRKIKKGGDEVFSTVKGDNIETGCSKRCTDQSTLHQRYRVGSAKVDNNDIANQKIGSNKKHKYEQDKKGKIRGQFWLFASVHALDVAAFWIFLVFFLIFNSIYWHHY